MKYNHFQGTPESPYHISIGGVVRNERGEVCCHYFDKVTLANIATFEDMVLLMRESLEPGESIETCLARGLMEEFGIKAELKSYLGSIVSRFPIPKHDHLIEKTTLYFLCDFVSIDESLRKQDDVEAKSRILWLQPSELIVRMKEQGKRLNREDADESAIIERLLIKQPRGI
jgi:ADP-ribose pyrophosphatase YjhB (NUDIX family)